MKILVLCDRFIPEISAPSFRIHEHAKEWIALGHEVTVVTCVPNAPAGKIFKGYSNWPPYQVERIDGITVIRVWSYMTANQGTIRRILDYVSYMLSSCFFFWKYPAFDVVIASSPTLFTAVSGWFLSATRHKPWIFEVRDLWPASIEAVDAKIGPPIKMLEKLEMFLYRKSSRIISVSRSIKENIAGRGIDPSKIDVITNGVDVDQYNKSKVTFDARKRLGATPGQIVVGYMGTIGMAHGLQTILEAGERTKDRNDIVWVIIGDGAERKAIEKIAEEKGLKNVIVRSAIPKMDTVSYLASFDISLIHLKRTALFKKVIPSKIFESMAIGTPIILGVEGESAEIISKSGGGVCITPEDSRSLAKTVADFADNPDSLACLRNNAIDFVKRNYSRQVLAKEMLAVLEQLVGRSQPTPELKKQVANQ